MLADLDPVTAVQLTAATTLELAVDLRGQLAQQRLDFAAAVDDPGELEQLAEPDRLLTDGDLLEHSANLASAAIAHGRFG